MATLLSITLFLIFIVLALIHFNWVIGGTWGFDQALPTDTQGEKLFTPGKIDSAIVGFGLAAFGFFYLLQTSFINIEIPQWIEKYTAWVIPAIFLLRAVGDFKYVGFFKKIKDTEFGKTDARIFSPLCLLIAILGIIIVLQ
ncbi:MAG: hypothetical protein ACI85O_000123 [Saprospiraceae bacterium]|jgi:hypothetical protein